MWHLAHLNLLSNNRLDRVLMILSAIESKSRVLINSLFRFVIATQYTCCKEASSNITVFGAFAVLIFVQMFVTFVI